MDYQLEQYLELGSLSSMAMLQCVKRDLNEAGRQRKLPPTEPGNAFRPCTVYNEDTSTLLIRCGVRGEVNKPLSSAAMVATQQQQLTHAGNPQ